MSKSKNPIKGILGSHFSHSLNNKFREKLERRNESVERDVQEEGSSEEELRS